MYATRPSHWFSMSKALSFVSVRCALLMVFVAAGVHPRLVAQEAAHRKVLVRVAPEYPETLRLAQIGGLVRLSATVLANGTVTQVEVRGGNPILAERAQKAVMKWKYSPAAAQTVEEVSLSFSPH
jgi:TonB family protein